MVVGAVGAVVVEDVDVDVVVVVVVWSIIVGARPVHYMTLNGIRIVQVESIAALVVACTVTLVVRNVNSKPSKGSSVAPRISFTLTPPTASVVSTNNNGSSGSMEDFCRGDGGGVSEGGQEASSGGGDLKGGAGEEEEVEGDAEYDDDEDEGNESDYV